MGWKLLLLLPRMILFRPSRGGTVPRKELEARIELFKDCGWSCSAKAPLVQRGPTLSQSAEGVVNVLMRRHALCPLWTWRSCLQRDKHSKVRPWPRYDATLRARTDPERRPPIRREGLSRKVAENPACGAIRVEFRGVFDLSQESPSGEPTSSLCWRAKGHQNSQQKWLGLLSVGRVTDAILQAIRLGRLTALQKHDGGVRGIVSEDWWRRTMAKQIAKKVEAATALPVRPENQGRMRVRHSCLADPDRC